MDPKKINELILAGREERNPEIDFDVSEILEEYSAVDKALKELQNAVRDFEDQNEMVDDLKEINRRLELDKIAMQFEGVDAIYER